MVSAVGRATTGPGRAPADEGVEEIGCRSARDDRVRRVIDMYGFTDLSLPSVQTEIDLIINQGAPPMGIGLYIMVEVGKVPFERVAIAVLIPMSSPFVFTNAPPLLPGLIAASV